MNTDHVSALLEIAGTLRACDEAASTVREQEVDSLAREVALSKIEGYRAAVLNQADEIFDGVAGGRDLPTIPREVAIKEADHVRAHLTKALHVAGRHVTPEVFVQLLETLVQIYDVITRLEAGDEPRTEAFSEFLEHAVATFDDELGALVDATEMEAA